VSVEAAVEEEIMSKQPRSRPQRPSNRRTAGQTTRKRSTARTGATRKTAARKRTSTARRQSASTKAKNNPSVPEQAIGAAISAARLPLRITAGLARRANDLIRR
jgi:hypothetical protein